MRKIPPESLPETPLSRNRSCLSLSLNKDAEHRTDSTMQSAHHHCITLRENEPLRPVLNLVAIAGPTGAGKSELALAVASRFHGEILNCDSIQIYRFFDIGAAKLPEQARLGIHH